MHSRYTAVCLALGYLMATSTAADALSRQDAIRIALERNPEVIAAKNSWEAAKARSVQAGALPDPELELEYEELPGLTRFGKFGERAWGVNQRIEFPLKWWRRSKAARRAAEAVRLGEVEMVRLDISSRVKMAYDRILFKRQNLEYVRQDLRLAQDFLQKARLRLEAGDVSQLEVLRAEVEAGRAASRLTKARSELEIAGIELGILLARENGTSIEVEGDLDYQPIGLELGLLQQTAIERRPDLQGVEWALESARAEQGAIQAALLPDLNVGLSRQTIQEAGGKEDFWGVSFALELPLWGAARQRGELSEAKALVRQSAAEKNIFRYQIFLEVESAYMDVQTSAAQVLLFQERIVREAERTFEVARRSYAEGKATYMELLEAQRALTGVREEYAEVLFNYHTALVSLERAVGGELPD